MKKFMIFLLMAFLYLGTCQARSEASHPDNAKLKLLSWVTPTPSQSFLTRSADLQADPDEVTVQIDGVHEGCAQAWITLTALVNYDQLSNFHYVWKLDGEALVAQNGVVNLVNNGQVLEFRPEALFSLVGDNVLDAPVTHEFTVEVSYGDCSLSISPVHLFTIDPMTELQLFLPPYACNGQPTTTATAALVQGTTPDAGYRWFVITATDTFTHVTASNQYVIPNDVLTVAEKVGVIGLYNNQVCNTTDTSWKNIANDYFQPMHSITISGNNVICNGDSAVLVAHVDPANEIVNDDEELSSPYSYAWSNGTDKDTLVAYTPGIYTVTVTNNNTHCEAIASVNVNVFGADLQLTANKLAVCNGEQVVLNANLDGFNNENIVYSWNTNPVQYGSTVAVIPTADAHQYIVTAQAGACQMADTIDIQVSNGVHYTTEVTLGSPNSICLGDESFFFATATPAATYFEWYVDGVQVPGENLSHLLITFDDINMHTVAAKAVAASCDTSDLSELMGVVVNKKPAIALTGNNVICNGDQAQITASVTNETQGFTGYVFNWSNNASENNPVLTATQSGLYTLTVTNSGTGCSAMADVNVTVFGGDLQLTADQTVVCPNTPVVLNANLDGFNNENISYQWTKVGGSVVGNGSTITVTPQATSKYAVKATAGDCEMKDTIEITVNPATNYTTVIYNSQHSNIYSNNGSRLNYPAHYCEGQEIATYYVKDDASTGNSTTLYNWYVDGIEVATAARNMIIPTGMEVGSHYVTAMAVVSGCNTASMSNSMNFIIHPAPQVTISGNNVICNGDTAFLTANATTMPYQPNMPSGLTYSYNYAWSDNANTQIDIITAAGLYTVTATSLVTYTNHHTNNLPVCTATASVNVISSGANMQIVADRTVICAGEYVTLGANFEGFVNENASYVWTLVNDNHTQIATTSNITVNPTADTSYALTINAGECSISDTIEILVKATPGTIAVTTEDASICAGTTATITATPDANAVSYIWYQNGIEIPGATMSTITVTLNEAGTYKYTAKGVSANGCISDTVTNKPAEVTVIAAPEVTLAGNNIICNGDNAEITATVTNAAANSTYTYYWSNNPNTSNAKLTTNVGGIYTVTVTNTTNNVNCVATASVEVITNGADLQIIADNTEICEGEHVTLSANFDGFVNENATYQWRKLSAGSPVVATTANYTDFPTSNQHYFLTVNAGDCSISDNIWIYVHERPVTPSLNNANPSIACEGQQVTFSVQGSTSALAANTYVWYVDGVEMEGEHLASIDLSFDNAGIYTVKARTINQYGCASLQPSSPKSVTVVANPEITLSGNNVICNGDNAVITANVTPSSTYTFTWSNGATGSVLTTDIAGTYTVTATRTSPNCSATATIEINTFGSDLQITADKVDICAGEYVTINANIDGYNNENVNYTWTSDPASTIINSSSIVVNPTQSTKYVVTAQAGDCSKKDSINIHVNAIPGNIAVAASPAAICEGAQDTIYVTGDNTADSYIWYQNGIEIPGQNLDTIIVTLNEAGSYSFAAKGVSNHGCVSEHASTTPAVVTVNDTPEFTLTGNNIICNGAVATITATPASYTYQWQGHAGSGNAHTYDAAGTYAVTATANGCSTVQTFNIYTNGSDLQVTADRMEVCEGEMVVLNANLDGFVNDNITYTWTGDSLTATTGSTVSAVPSITGHVYTVVASTGDVDNACTMTGTIDITVHAAPSMMDVSLNTDDIICAGGQATFVATAQPNNVNYIWFQNGVQIPGENLGTITVNLNEPGTYVYSAMAIDQYGCTSAAAVASTTSVTDQGTYVGTNYSPVRVRVYDGWFIVPLTHYETYYEQGEQEENVPGTVTLYFDLTTMLSDTVTVNAAPDFTLSGNNIICNGATATISATSNTEDTYEYTWSNGQTGATFTTTTAGTYSVTATDGTCTSVQTFNIYTNGSDLQVYADRMEVCEGEMVVLNANLDGFTNDNISYVWDGHNMTSHNGSTVSAIPTVNDHVYTVTASTTGTNEGCTMTGTINITVYPVPAQVTVEADRNLICEGGQVTFHADGDASAYIWYQNGIEIPGENQAYITRNFNEIGLYYLTAKAVSNHGCVSAQASDPAVVNVVMQPTVAITGDAIICDGTDVQLFAQVNDTVAGMSGYQYDWRLFNYTLNSEEVTTEHFEELWQLFYWMITGHPYTTTDTTVETPQFLEDYVMSTSFDNTDHITVSNLPAQDNPYIFTLIVTTPEGCRVVSDPYYVYVNSNPTVVATVSDTVICPNGEITATTHIGDGHQPGLNFQWQYAPAGTDNWQNIPFGLEPTLVTDMFSESVDLRVVVTQNGVGNNSGCTATSDPVRVNVVIPQAIAAVVAVNGIDTFPATNICEGAQLYVTAYFEDENGERYIDSTHNYMWELNGIVMPDIHGPQFSAQAYIYDNDPVDYTYTAYIIYDVPGCQPMPMSSNTVHVRRNPIVTIDGTPNVCFYGNGVDDNNQPINNVILTAWVDGVEDVDATYTWYESGQLQDHHNGSANIYKDNWTPTALNPYIFTVEVTNGDGCSTISEPYYVNVYQKPYVNITNETGTDICQGGDVTLRASLNNYNDPMLTYQWYENIAADGYAIPGATHEFETFTPNETTNYIVKVTHLMDFTYEHCVAYDTITVAINPRPTVDAMDDLVNVDTICEGRAVTMTVTNVTPGVAGGEVYTWYRNGVEIPDAHGINYVDYPTAVNGEPTVYVYGVSVTQEASGCYSDITYIDTVLVNPNPALVLSTDPIVCTVSDETPNVVLAANVDPTPVTPITFRWMEDNTEIAVTDADTLRLFKPYREYPYNFSVQVVNDYGCSSEAFATVYVNDSIVVNITASEDSICLGGQVALNAALNDWNADMLTFQWFDNGEEIAGATTLNYVATPSTEGSHEYTLTINQLTSGCIATSTVAEVYVNVIPEATASYVDLDATSICDGRTVVINASVVDETGVTGGEVYTWYRNGEVIANVNGPVLVDNPMSVDNEPMIYHYGVSVRQTASGCESVIYNGLDNITVYPNPTIALVTDPIVCVEDSNNVILTANVFPAPETEVSYLWFEDNDTIMTTTANTLTLTKEYRDYPYSFSVMLLNEYGCSATADAQVYVNDSIVVTITATENNICVGGEITLSATLNDWNADMLTFQWSDNGEEIPGATMLHYTVVPTLDTHVYTLTVNQLTSGCVATSNEQEVVVNPIPVINGIQLSNNNICFGGQLEITALVDNHVDGEVYTWYRNGILMEGATAATIFDTPGIIDNNTQQYEYTAIVTRPAAGCVSMPVTSATVTVYPNPTPVITGDQHVCETDSVFLIANVDTTGMAAGSLHYTWYESGQIRDNMGYNLGDSRFYAEYLYARTEPYRFTVEVSRNTVENGCSATSAEYLVYVYPQPVVNITATETQICENGQVTLTANLNDYNAQNITYQWYTVGEEYTQLAVGYDADGNYIYITDTTIVHNIIPGATSATYTTSLTETTVIGVDVLQTNSTCTANDEITIVVNPIPVVTAITVSEHEVCNGAQVIVYATTEPAAEDIEGAVFTWYRNGVVIPGANMFTLQENVYTTDNHVTQYSYTAIVTLPASGCQSSNMLVNLAEDYVNVNPAPSTVNISGNNVICEGSTTTLHAYSDVEGTFIWSNDVEGVDSIVVPAGVYTVTMLTAEGCEMTSEPFTVEAFGTDLLVSASATSICQGEHTTLYVNQDGWQGDVTYLWCEDANNSIATTVDVQPLATTTYHVTATVSSTNGSCSQVGEVTIIVNPMPVIDSVTVSNTLICEGNQVTFTAFADENATSYIWYNNGIEIPGENQAVITYTFNQAAVYNFSVKAISNENCVAAVAVNAPAVTVTPAPTQVSITGENVICFGTTAELVAHSDVEGTFAWSNGMTGDTINVTAGIYNVTVTTSEGCSLTSPDYVVESFGTDLIVSATETSICEGDHTTLSVDQEGWNGNVTYEWSTGSTATTIDVTPVATTTYYVTATVNNEAGSCSTVGEITITVNPRPATLALLAVPDSVCVGEQYQVVAVDTTLAGNISGYIWYENGVEMEGENQMYLTLSQDQAGVYRYAAKAISNEGCVSAHASAQVYVHVIAAPEAVVISGNTTICNGGSTVLSANVTPNEPATFAWYKNDVPMNTNTSSIVVTEAGSYKVEASFNGCTTVSAPVVVTVEQAPQLQLTATESVICVGGSTVITAEATGWNNADVNYNWNNGYQGSSYVFNATTAGTETFIVNASQATSGCSATDTITITVNAIPATPQITVDNAIVCDGGQVTLQVANAIQGATYTWYRNGTLIAGATQATISDSPVTVDGDLTTYVYSVVATLPMSGCESEASANAIVTVIPTPVATVSVDGNTTFCQGGSTTLHVNVSPATNYSYQWYKDNVLIEGATQADLVVSEVARETAYNFSVVVTANPGCNVTADAPAITVLADPIVTATISNDIVCVGGVATLTAVVEGGVAGVNGLNDYTYEWYRNTPNTDPANPSATSQLVATGPVYTTDGTEAPNNYTYWVVVNNAYNCNALSAPVNFSVVELPVVTITRVAEYDATVCDGGETAIKANVTGGYGEISYQWYKNGNLMPGENNQVLNIPVLSYGVNDTYTVEVTQTGVGCSNSASAAINTLVTVNPAYTVDITGFGNVCEGGTLTLTATVNNVIAGDVLSYQWYKIMNGEDAPINGANAATYSTSDLLLGNSYEYFVVVNSSISGCTTISSTVPANVVAAPSVAIQGANTVCEGGSLTLNAFVTGGVDGTAYTYTWNWTGAANGSAVTAEPSYVPTLTANDYATPYYFTVTISRTDNTGCTATSAAHEVNVLAVPTVSVTADNAYVCQNGDVTLTAHVSPVGTYNYVWTINGQQQAVNAATVTTSMATVGAINASVVVSAANASASCSATATLAVPVQVVAAPSVTIAADHTTMCVGGTTTLTANVAVNGNIPADFSYQWAINGIEVDGAVANTFVQPLNAAGVYTYTLRVSQNNNLGCNSTWSAPVTVQVAEQPVVTLSSVDGLDICEGGSITLTATVTNYGNTVNGVTNSNIYGPMTFDWTRNGANVHQDANVNTAMKQFTETLNTIGNYNYTVTVDAAGYNCQPQVSNAQTVNVVGNPSWTDVHVYSNNGTDACLGEMVYLMAAIQGGVSDGASSTNGHIQWVVTDENGNTVEVSGGLGGNSYDIPSVAGTYVYTPTFVGNIGSGCQLTNTGDVQVGVTVHELPTAVFTSGDGVSLCANDGSASAELVISFTGVAPFVYEVVDGNGNVVAHATTLANTVSVFVSPTEQTTYRISLVQDAYCENTALDANAIATVYVNEVTFDQNIFVSGCNDNGQVTVFFNVISGNPAAAFTVTYENGTTYSGTISNGTATFAAPTTPGDYNATLTIDGCSYDIVIRVLVGDYGFGGTLPIMDQRWNDVVVVNNNPETNGGHTFVGFQWYHNGVAIPGATYSNYQDKDGLNGFYSVELIEQDADGNMVTYMTCEMYFNTTSTVKVYPVPANVRQEITIELDLTSEQLEGAVLDIYSVTGAHISHVTDLQPITKIEGFKAQGTYFGRILTGTNEIKTVKFVIVK